uniref:major capsid protein n=1 Tax=Chryseobacterium sp. OSA05B TaxID=2862650 RepID=UPI001CBB3031
MPVTLAQASQNAQTDLDTAVIDEFRTNSILDLMTFDDAVNPSGGGNTLVYGYRRLITAPTAAFRAINSEYVPQEVTTQQFTTELKPLGGSFQIDRVLANIGAAASGEVALQTAQKIKAAQAKFGEAVILGDSAVDADSFDGLSKALTGSSTEDSTARNWSGLM